MDAHAHPGPFSGVDLGNVIGAMSVARSLKIWRNVIGTMSVVRSLKIWCNVIRAVSVA